LKNLAKLLKETKDFLKINYDLALLNKTAPLNVLFENYLVLERLVNIYSIMDCCVVDELGLYKLKYELEKNNIDLLMFLQEVDINKSNNKYDPKLIELYKDIIKDTKAFCWDFGNKLLPLRNEFRNILEEKAKIKISNDIVNDWIPRLKKFVFGVDYAGKQNKLRYPSTC